MAPAPALESRTQSPTTPDHRPKRRVPIIPAIPRSLERRPKYGAEFSKRVQSSVLCNGTTSNGGTHGGDTAVPLSTRQSGISVTIGSSDSVEEPQKLLPQAEPQGSHYGTETLQALDGTGQSSQQSPVPQTEDFALGYLSINDDTSEAPKSHITDGPLQAPLVPDEAVGSLASKQECRPHAHALRASASSFHTHPMPLDNMTGSATASPKEDHNVAQAVPERGQYISLPQTTPSAMRQQDLAPGYGHGHNISFFPPPTLSSNDPISPTRSDYKGYAYGATRSEYPVYPRPPGHYPQQFQPQLETDVSPERHFPHLARYYVQGPPYTAVGSQAPLTPSATPLDPLSASWRAPNGISYLPSEGRTPMGFESHFRSDSHSTFRSDNVLYSDNGAIHDNSPPFHDGTDDVQRWPRTEGYTDHGDVSGTPSGEISLTEHLLKNFNNPEYADCKLVLRNYEQKFPTTQWFLSSILLVQSRNLQDLLVRSKAGEEAASGITTLELITHDRFVTPASMESALHVLYGMPPSAFMVTLSNKERKRSQSEISVICMKKTLAYIASGRLLSLQSVVSKGLQLTCDNLSWDNLEITLTFGLDSGLKTQLYAPSSGNPKSSSSLAQDSDPSSSSRVIFTPSTSSANTGHQSGQPSSSNSPSEQRHHMPPKSDEDLLLYCLDFIAQSFPTSWELDLSARPLADVDRLPVTAESRSPLSRSRLSRIQFGNHPSEVAAKSSDRNVLLSTILFSLPYERLKYLLRSVGEPLGRKMGLIITERERRRHVVLGSKSVSWSERVTAGTQAWAEAGYEESVQTNDEGTTEISRKYTGIGQESMFEETGSH